MTAVIFPDVEKLLCDALPAMLAGKSMPASVGTRVPNPRPAEFYRILATGGNRMNLVESNPTVTVEAWAATETRASLMLRTCLAVIESLAGQVVGGSVVYRASDFSSPVNLPDPDSASVRYTSTGSIQLRGSALT